MKLIKLELTNVKSYKHEVINFSEGINCILGLNGSGKSTIIESIGNVLFNYSSRTNTNFIRYNEKKASIDLTFEGNDGRVYRIEKQIKPSKATVKIIDVDNNQVLQELVNDVYPFVKQILGIPKEKNLAKLFEEIIAIPQGSFVNAFLDTSKNRKDNFDKLFELDIYKQLANELKVLNDIVEKEYIHSLDNEIAELTGKLGKYDELEKELIQLNEILEKTNKSLEDASIIYNKKKDEKEVLDSYNTQLNELQNQINNLTIDKELEKQKVNTLNTKIESNKKAQEILKEHEFSYTLYKTTNIKLVENEKKYNKYLEYNEQLSNKTIDLSNKSNEHNIKSKVIHDLKVEIGNNKQTIIDCNNEITQINQTLKEINEEINPLKEQVKLMENEFNEKKTDYIHKYEKLNNISNYLLSYDKNVNVNEIDETIKDINNQLKVIEDNKTKINELEKELVRLDAELNNLNINNTYMKDGTCPILKQKCLNIKGNDLTIEITNLINQHNNDISNINKEIYSLTNENKNQESLEKEKGILEFKKINYNNNYKVYQDYMNDIKVNFEEAKHITIDNDYEIINNLISKYQDLKDNYQDLELEERKQKIQKLSNELFTNNFKINSNKSLIQEKTKIVEEKTKEKEKIEHELQSINEDINIINNDIEKLKENISKYAIYKQELEENKKVIENNKESYELYIQNKNEADSLNNNLNDLEIANKNLTQLDIKIKEICDNQLKIKEKYSKETYDNLQSQLNELTKQITTDQTTIKYKNERKEIVELEIKHLDDLYAKQKEKEKLLLSYKKLSEKYKIMRDVFSNLPRELSEQIRKYISIYASSLYRNISSENVRIEMADDYEVSLIDCSDETKVKSLSQLSGGEQMSVAIAIRLAMLKQTTGVEFYFMDEPTINLDTERRMKLTEVVKDISTKLRQLYVISHDDTFESITDNTIKISKVNNESRLDN